MRVLLVAASFVVSSCVLVVGAARAAAPSLPFTQESNAEEYLIRFTNVGSHALPISQAQDAADALDRSGNDVPGNPKGYHDGYVDLGFLEPYFTGSRIVDFWNCKTDDDTPCDNGQATVQRIRMPTSNYSTLQNPGGSMSTEACVREVLGHELFHHVEYAYTSEAGGSGCGPWGAAACEGMARMMQDQIYTDIDTAGSICISAQGEFNNYLNDPNRTLWSISYSAALFWKYIAEQYGNVTVEPEAGADVIRRWWENAVDDYDTPDIIQLTRETIQDFGGGGVDTAFHHFTIANAAKDYDLSPLSNSEEARFSYRDEAQGFLQSNYASVPIVGGFAHVEPGTPAGSLNIVLDYGASYRGAEVDECGYGSFLHFDVEQAASELLVSLGVMGLVLIDGGGKVYDVDKKVGTTWHWTQTQGIPNAKQVIATFGALGDLLLVNYEFRCGYPIDVDFPLTNGPQPTHGGPPGAFGLVALDIDVQEEEGRVIGLEPESFQVRVGPAMAALPATVLAKLETPLGARLLVRAPDGLGAGAHRIAVDVGTLGAAADGAFQRGDRLPDQVLLFDRSQSMASAVGTSTRFAIAQRAAARVVTAAPDGSQLGIVSFAGDGSEPNDDANEELELGAVDASHRGAALAALAGLAAPSGPTSIGDGLFAAARDLGENGAPNQERHIFLLSDGGESEAADWPAARAAIAASGARVHAIALGANADQGLLAEIAAETDGTFQYVDLAPAATLPTRLGDAFLRAADRANGRQRFFDAQQAIAASETVVVPIDVEAGLESMRLVATWDDPSHAIDTTLRAPDGTAQDSQFNPFEYTISKPVAGTWHLEITAIAGSPTVQIAGSGASFDGTYLVTAATHTLGDGPPVGRTGGFASAAPIVLQAALVDASGPVLGASGTAVIEHPDGRRDSLALRDDGRHADAVEDDGVYTASYRRTTAFSATGLPETAQGSRGSYSVRYTMFRADGTPLRHDASAIWIGQGPIDDGDGDGLLDRYEAEHRCLANSTPAEDPDGDRLTSMQELGAGTDPCDSDTDHGGENDGSELARGADPGDPRDDLLPAPGWFATESRISELHVPDDPRFVPQPNAILLRVPSAKAYAEVLIERRETASSTKLPWMERLRVDPRTLGGAFLDAGLTPGLNFEYRMRGIDADGNESALTRILAATVKTDPLAPIGSLRILAGPRTDDTSVPVAIDLYGDDDPEEIEMRLQSPGLRSGGFVPYAAETVLPLATVAEPTAQLLTARLRDAAQNESLDYSEEILVYPPNSLGSIRGVIERTAAGDPSGVLVRLAGMALEAIGVSMQDGSFVLDDLLPGTYTVELLDGPAVGARVMGVVVDPGAATDVGTVSIPEAGTTSAALVALAALWRLAARRRR